MHEKWGISCNDTIWLGSPGAIRRIFFILGQILIIGGTCENVGDISENVHWWRGWERERSCLAVLRWRWLIGKLEESGNLLGRRERNLYFPLGAIFRVPSIVFFSSRMPRGMGQSIDNEDNKIIISKRVTTIKWSNALAVLVVTRKRRTTVSLPVTSSQLIVVIYPHGLRLIVILAWYIFEFCLASQMSHCVRRSPSTYQIE